MLHMHTYRCSHWMRASARSHYNLSVQLFWPCFSRCEPNIVDARRTLDGRHAAHLHIIVSEEMCAFSSRNTIAIHVCVLSKYRARSTYRFRKNEAEKKRNRNSIERKVNETHIVLHCWSRVSTDSVRNLVASRLVPSLHYRLHTHFDWLIDADGRSLHSSIHSFSRESRSHTRTTKMIILNILSFHYMHVMCWNAMPRRQNGKKGRKQNINTIETM